MALTDIELVMLAKAAQDETAFAELVRRHQAGLRVFLRRFCRDETQADDLAQESLLKCYRRLSQFEGGASFRSWLYAIGWREFLQAKRKEDALGRLKTALAGEPEATVRNPADRSLDLNRALAQLEENERAAALLCDAAGLSHAEAAAALGMPLGSIKTCVARAREKLRDALGAPSSTPNHNGESNVRQADRTAVK